MKVTLLNVTPNAEDHIVEVARVSSSRKNKKDKPEGLLRYLVQHKHWSPFEHSYATFEIETSKAIGIQLIRHRSFSFQEFSQRYSEATEFEPIELRKKAKLNRQSSLEVFDPEINYEYLENKESSEIIQLTLTKLKMLYDTLIDKGVSKKTARSILPECTQTHMYMNGTIRSWLSFLNVRLDKHSQQEIRDIAIEVANILKTEFPLIVESTNNFNDFKGLFM